MGKNRIEAGRMQQFFEEHKENLNKIIDSQTQTIKHLEALIKKLKADHIESPSVEMAMKQQQRVVKSQETILQEPTNTIPTTSNKQWNEEPASIYQRINGLGERLQQIEGCRMVKQ